VLTGILQELEEVNRRESDFDKTLRLLLSEEFQNSRYLRLISIANIGEA